MELIATDQTPPDDPRRYRYTGAQVYHLRVSCAITQASLAQLLGVATALISYWERRPTGLLPARWTAALNHIYDTIYEREIAPRRRAKPEETVGDWCLRCKTRPAKWSLRHLDDRESFPPFTIFLCTPCLLALHEDQRGETLVRAMDELFSVLSDDAG